MSYASQLLRERSKENVKKFHVSSGLWILGIANAILLRILVLWILGYVHFNVDYIGANFCWSLPGG